MSRGWVKVFPEILEVFRNEYKYPHQGNIPPPSFGFRKCGDIRKPPQGAERNRKALQAPQGRRKAANQRRRGK